MKIAALLLTGLVCAGPVWAQQIQLGDGGFGPARAEGGKSHVELLTDSIAVDAGKPQTVELRFRVQPGFHINSHKPKDELLIPTVLKLDAGGVKALDESYPAGAAFKLPVGGTVLDVYQNEFRVIVRVVAQRGQSTMTGSLRYQACDNAACYPPKTLAVKVALTGR
ncbi:MAG: protein-disulfide reductase DsbD N-terminal domain-containing protein [Acidobacteriota bacterium]